MANKEYDEAQYEEEKAWGEEQKHIASDNAMAEAEAQDHEAYMADVGREQLAKSREIKPKPDKRLPIANELAHITYKDKGIMSVKLKINPYALSSQACDEYFTPPEPKPDETLAEQDIIPVPDTEREREALGWHKISDESKDLTPQRQLEISKQTWKAFLAGHTDECDTDAVVDLIVNETTSIIDKQARLDERKKFEQEYPLRYKEEADLDGVMLRGGWMPPGQFQIEIEKARQDEREKIYRVLIGIMRNAPDLRTLEREMSCALESLIKIYPQ